MEKEIAGDLFVLDDKLEWQDVGEGVKRKILGYDAGIMMVAAKFAKGGVGYLHKHPHRQVTYVSEGEFEVQIGNEKKLLKKGDCFYIPPGVEHGAVCKADGLLIDVFNPHREDFL
jgi:quercetin dioxygenase-like cupin family protein